MSSKLMMMIALIFMALITTMFYILNKKEKWSTMTTSCFECGFMNFNASHNNFSIQFFMLGVIFLFLDLEFCLAMPFFMEIKMNIMETCSMILVMMFILVGMLMECYMKCLEWKL